MGEAYLSYTIHIKNSLSLHFVTRGFFYCTFKNNLAITDDQIVKAENQQLGTVAVASNCTLYLCWEVMMRNTDALNPF